MVFLAKRTISISRKDIISWLYDEVPYDQGQPVSNYTSHDFSTKGLVVSYLTAEQSPFEDLH